MIDYTIILAVDENHLTELTYSYRTWEKFKPDMLSQKMVIMYDCAQIRDTDKRFNVIKNPFELIPWTNKEKDGKPLYENQREKMLNSLVFGVNEIKTPWYLKIDTDAVATNYGQWIYDEWFAGDNVLISNPWGYTKPANLIERLDDWGDKIPEVAKYPRLDLPYNPGDEVVRHKRIISWMLFGNTDWTKTTISYLEDKLPVPSQDSYLVFLAQRMKKSYLRMSFKKYGFTHILGLRRIKSECERLLAL